MTDHIQQILIAHTLDCNASFIVNIDSAIQDDTVMNELSEQNLMCATFGTKNKQPASFLSLHKGKILIFGSIAVLFAFFYSLAK